ncbi:hypothetical protein CF15_05695 [Pyrodictium occultum]|uniref:CBS domain-containing protein n=1 Tax=Pyrodictium occultum TaxID=2309 RepID=A0A0V8RW19_PYROC|nr:CBS domain-containing protein [Pyrodictium occultum]KSW12245.1 hypothetical protein CF15_05695 [Pyrodictium occultum]
MPSALLLRFYETIEPDATVAKAIRLLGTRGISHAAVVDDEGLLIGVVSVKDLARHLLDVFEDAGAVERFNFKAALETSVYEVANKPPYVAERMGPREAAEIMIQRGIGFLPVVDESGRFISAYTELDYAMQLLGSNEPARCYATHSLVMGDPSEPLIEALGYMYEKGFRRLPLNVDEEYYLATMTSILMAIARRPSEDTLLEPLASRSAPAPVLDYEAAVVSDVAELILSVNERALLLLDGERLARAIITERDLLRAYLGRGEC